MVFQSSEIMLLYLSYSVHVISFIFGAVYLENLN